MPLFCDSMAATYSSELLRETDDALPAVDEVLSFWATVIVMTVLITLNRG